MSNYDKLVIEVELPDFNADGALAFLDEECDPNDPNERAAALLDIVTDEWMRSQVGLTVVTVPGEKCLSNDFEVVGMTARIVGARIIPAELVEATDSKDA